MISRLLASFAGRRLAKRGSEKVRERILEKTRQMRRELGLSEDRRLA